MPDPRQLSFLENLAAEKADALALQLAKARRAVTAAEEQLQQLQRYEAGYNSQLGEKLEASIAIDALRGHHRFMQNVAHAVRQQALEVARRQAFVDGIDRAWQESERRRQGFRVMAVKLNAQARLAETRRQQKDNDEFASRKVSQSHVGF